MTNGSPKFDSDQRSFSGRLVSAGLNQEAWVWVFLRLLISSMEDYDFDDADEVVKMIRDPSRHL